MPISGAGSTPFFISPASYILNSILHFKAFSKPPPCNSCASLLLPQHQPFFENPLGPSKYKPNSAFSTVPPFIYAPLHHGTFRTVTNQSQPSMAQENHEQRPEMFSANLKAVLFDLDGTCVNSDHIHFEAYRDTLLQLVPNFNAGKPISRPFYDSQMSGLQNPQLLARILPQLPIEQQTRIWQSKEICYENAISAGLPAVDGLLELLRRLAQKRIITYIVTNAPRATCSKTMKSIGVTEHFGSRVVVSEECEHAKPHPAPYLRALQLAGVSANETICFEDSPSGATSASAAGVFTIGVRSTQSDSILRSSGCAFTICDYNDSKLSDVVSNLFG